MLILVVLRPEFNNAAVEEGIPIHHFSSTENLTRILCPWKSELDFWSP